MTTPRKGTHYKLKLTDITEENLRETEVARAMYRESQVRQLTQNFKSAASQLIANFEELQLSEAEQREIERTVYWHAGLMVGEVLKILKDR